MTKDTQHLDFLISQYVDQTLDPANRRMIEQKITADSTAAALFKEHCDVQEVLDDWGSRLPLIDWDQFDRTLAARLERETVPGAAQRVTPLGRSSRVLAAAAALFVAATVGYTWHALSAAHTQPFANARPPAVTPVVPEHSVAIMKPATTGPALDTVAYEHPPVVQRTNRVELLRPTSPAAPSGVTALDHPPAPGLQNMPSNTGSVVGSAAQPPHKPDRTDLPQSDF